MNVDFGKWLYHVEQKWRTNVRNRYELIGFAFTVASFGDDGRNNYPMNCTLAQLGNMSERTVRRLKSECVSVGLLKQTGTTERGVPIFAIAIPPDDESLDEPDPWDDPWPSEGADTSDQGGGHE